MARKTHLQFVTLVGRRVAQLRRERGLSGEELGARIGGDKGTISRIERAAPPLSLRRLSEIADALGVSPADIVSVQAPLPVDQPVRPSAPIVEVWEKLDRRHQRLLLDVGRAFAAVCALAQRTHEGAGPREPMEEELFAAESRGSDEVG